MHQREDKEDMGELRRPMGNPPRGSGYLSARASGSATGIL
jgi:hypothetical protein